MKWLCDVILKLTEFMNKISGIALTSMILLTVADVILRYFGKPITGSYELVSFAGGVVIGFALPFSSWMKAHIYMDFFILRLTKQKRDLTMIFTRVLGIILFLVAGIYLFKKGISLYKTGEVSMTLEMPFYPLAYGLGICCFVQCLILLSDIIRIKGAENE